jgi:hypothetical protein
MRRHGISLVLVNSRKGMDVFDSLRSLVNVFETTAEKAAVQPALQMKYRGIPARRKDIYENLGKMDYRTLVRKFIFDDAHYRSRRSFFWRYMVRYHGREFLVKRPHLHKLLSVAKALLAGRG